MTGLLAAVLALWAPAAADPLPLTLDEAVQLGLLRDYALQQARLDVDEAKARVEEVYGSVYPSVDLSLGYTRNFETANPFQGSDAGSLFSALGSSQWLAFNEVARTDGDPNTNPITLEEFTRRQGEAISAAGGDLSTSDNPFFVPNQFSAALTVTQNLYNGGAFKALDSVEALEAQSRAGVRSRALRVVSDVSRAYYGALLAAARVEVLDKSIERARETLAEVTRQVEQGVAPKFQQLSAEVVLANLETSRLQAANGADQARDVLRMALALPAGRPLALRGELAVPAGPEPSALAVAEATDKAVAQRPDLESARQQIALLEVNRDVTRTGYLPTIVANLRASYIGNVPDDRTGVAQVDGNPFLYRETEESFFSDAYWSPALSAGITLTWNLFDGFATTARVRQSQASVARARVQLEQLEQTVRVEVEAAHRDLRAARRQLDSQARTIERAELNYAHAKVRVQEGVSSPLELREASEQLDQSRLNQLQAVHDYLVAWVRFQVAVGDPPGADAATGRPRQGAPR
ncbi:MAG: TolC family protein [Myxococcales bacterium]|nr:TolC family protein [Myxococcales bacterium]